MRSTPKIASGMIAAARSVSVSRVWKERVTRPGSGSGGWVMPQSSSARGAALAAPGVAVSAFPAAGRVAISR